MDYRSLPKLRDSTSYVYAEHARIDRELNAIAIVDKDGVTPVPAADLSLVLLGPGTTITHEAVKTLADNGVAVAWVGDGAIRYYAHGIGETRKGYKLLRQARLASDENARLRVVRAMYAMRLGLNPDPSRTLDQLRGMEGARVRHTYAEFSKRTGVPWHGRNYNRGDWSRADEVNRAISAANACLYGIVHTAVVTGGYSAGLGFIHTGKQLSFVYDLADLYKAETSIHVAFETTARGERHLERSVRHACRDRFREVKLLDRILPDIDRLFDLGEDPDARFDWLEDDDPSKPLPWWTPEDTTWRPEGQEPPRTSDPPEPPEPPPAKPDPGPWVAGPDAGKPGTEDF